MNIKGNPKGRGVFAGVKYEKHVIRVTKGIPLHGTEELFKRRP